MSFFWGKVPCFAFNHTTIRPFFLLVALRSFILLFTYDLFPCPLFCSSRSVKLQYTHRHSIFRKRHPFSFTGFHLLISTPLVYLSPVIFIFVCQHCIIQSIALLEFSMFLVQDGIQYTPALSFCYSIYTFSFSLFRPSSFFVCLSPSLDL